MSSFSRRQYTDANRDAWNEAAPRHRANSHAELLQKFSSPDYNHLHQHYIEPLQKVGVQGKSVAQICCNNGADLLSVKNMGAGPCVGFDAAGQFIEQARELTQAAGHDDVDFVVTDIYDISPDYHARFDIVIITIGVISWMPDLAGFFKTVTALIKPGGYLFFEDMHPVLMMYEEGEGDAPSYPAYSYFRKEPWVETTGLDYLSGTPYESRPNYSFQHTVAEVLTTAIDNKLALRHFSELDYDISFMCADLEHAEIKPPLGMMIVWQKGGTAGLRNG